MTNEHRLTNIDTALYVPRRRQRRRPHRLHRLLLRADMAAAQLREPACGAPAAVGERVPGGAAGGGLGDTLAPLTLLREKEAHQAREPFGLGFRP